MPAPGGKFAGSSSSSRGYAGGTQQRSANAATGSRNYGGSSSSQQRSANAATGAGGYGGSRSSQQRSANAATGSSGYGGGRTGGGMGFQGSVSRPGSYAGPKGATSLNQAARNAALSVSTPRSYAGPKGAGMLNRAARVANLGPQGFSRGLPQVDYSTRDLDLATRINLAENRDILNAKGGIQTGVIQGVGDVMRNRVISSRFPDTLKGVLTQKGAFSPYNKSVRGKLSKFGPKNPDYAATYGTLKSIMEGETAPVVGGALNYGNKRAIANPGSIKNPAMRPSAASQRAFASMTGPTYASARNPNLQHTFGTLGKAPSDVAFNGVSSTPARTIASPRAPAPGPAFARVSPAMTSAFNAPRQTIPTSIFQSAPPATPYSMPRAKPFTGTLAYGMPRAKPFGGGLSLLGGRGRTTFGR